MLTFDQYYAAGQWRQAGGNSTITIANPYTERSHATLTPCSQADVDAAVSAARQAFASWSTTAPQTREQVLNRLHTCLEQRSEAFVQSMVNELGVPAWVGVNMQVSMPLRNLRHSIDTMARIDWSENVGTSCVERIAAGVVAGITPWNFPLHQIVAKVAGALGAGCTLVLKPSEMAPGAAALFMEAVHEAGFPPGVINMVWGGADVGQWLTTHADIDIISFTGSEVVARHIAASAAPGLKQTAFELGGKSAALILPDADLDRAIQAAMLSCMMNSGQTCVAQSRLIVPRAQLDNILQRLVALAESPLLRLGNPADAETRIGPVANAAQFDRVNHAMETARHEGARLVVGGHGRPADQPTGYFVAPTVFADVNPNMRLAQEEVFGPVLAVLSYANEAEGIALANATQYGLSGAVWGPDTAAASAAARQLRTGQVTINGGPQNLATPFGGFGLSGYGRENGRYGIEAFLAYRSLQLPA